MPRSDSERSTLLQAFIDSRNEVDRSIFLSASGGVAFCAAMLFREDFPQHGLLSFWLLLSMLMFSATAALVLAIFRANARFIQRLIADDSASPRCPLIEGLEYATVVCFGLAVIAIGAAVATFHFC